MVRYSTGILAALAVLATITAFAARAADLDVLVRGPNGAPVADAVVTVQTGEHKPLPARFSEPLAMSQRNKQFDPFVLLVPLGADVRFPNQDDVRHQVYSFSPAKTFDLKLYGKEQTRVVHFDKPGVVALSCNIHDQMVAYLVVVDTAYAAKSDADGHAVIHGLPAGAVAVRVWHPYMKAADNIQSFDATLPAAGSVTRTVTAALRTPSMRMDGY